MNEEKTDQVAATTIGDGGAMKVSEAALTAAKAEVQLIADHPVGGPAVAAEMDGILRCEWSGQNDDGLKHDTDEKEAFPFDGALDTRVRFADSTLNETTMIAVLAAMKARVKVHGTEIGDNRHAALLETVVRWLRDSHFGAGYLRTLSRWIRWSYGDKPAVSLMEVHYQREMVLEMARVSMTELGALYVQMVTENMSEEEVQGLVPELQSDFEALRFLMLDPEGYLKEYAEKEGLPDAAAELMKYFPHLKMSRAKKVVKAAREQAKAGVPDPVFEFPRPVVKSEGPVLVARRIHRDWFIPANTADFQDARLYYIREWLTEAELRGRVVSMEYSQSFVDKVLAKGDGEGSFEYAGRTAFGIGSTEAGYTATDTDEFRGLFEVITQYRRAVNDENIPGVYAMTFHGDVDEAAGDEELVDYPHGDYPGVVLAREALSSLLVDSRGIPELAGPMQGAMKDFVDSAGNNAKLNTVPSFQTFGRRSSSRIRLGQLEENKVRRGGEIKPIQVGQYPASALKMAKELRRDANEYFGRADPEGDPGLVQIYREFLVLWVLSSLADVWKMVLQCVQDYMSPELFARIAGAEDEEVSRDAIRGSFDIRLEFDGRDFDFDYVKEKAKLYKEVLMGMDTKATGAWEEVLKSLMESADPILADRVFKDTDTAQQSEVDEESDNIVKMLAGIPVRPVEAGQNFPLRLQVLNEWAQANMERLQREPENTQAMFQERAKHLQFMTQQIENAQIGKVGV